MLALAEDIEDGMLRVYPRAAKVIRGCSRRRTGFSNAEVQVLWLHGFEASNTKGSLWSDGVKLYSYGTPIAVRCRNAVLVNTHFYSPTTCHHRPCVGEAVEVDFEILRRWVSYEDLEELYVLDIEDDAVLLFKDGGDNHYILMLRDEGREYGVKLPTPCRTIGKAREMLLPGEALAAVKEGRRVRRQGEWYFIAFPEMRFPKEAVEHPLRDGRRRDRHLGSHIPRDKVAWCFSVEETRRSRYFKDSTVYVFVRGTVRHARRDHRMLRLGEAWHLAARSPLRGVTAARGLD